MYLFPHTSIWPVASILPASLSSDFPRGVREGSAREDLACSPLSFAVKVSFYGAFHSRFLKKVGNSVADQPVVVKFPVPFIKVIAVPLLFSLIAPLRPGAGFPFKWKASLAQISSYGNMPCPELISQSCR